MLVAVYLPHGRKKTPLHYHIVAMVFQTQDLRSRHDGEVVRALIHQVSVWYPAQSRETQFVVIVPLWILAELHFSPGRCAALLP